MVSRKAGSADNDKQSAIVKEFLLQTQQQQQQPPPAPAAVVSSSGFVPRSADTEEQKRAQREWDRSELLKVDDEDAQVKIYHAYSANANTNAEGVNSRRGLGAASEGTAAGGGRGRMMSFVSAGGAPAFTPAATGTASSASSSSAAASTAALSVRVHGLPAAMSEADVREIFASCGRILRCSLDRSAYSSGSAPKGATVCFDARASAELAVKNMDGTKMRAHTLHVTSLDGASAPNRPKPY